jgi:hypothetical protein
MRLAGESLSLAYCLPMFFSSGSPRLAPIRDVRARLHGAQSHIQMNDFASLLSSPAEQYPFLKKGFLLTGAPSMELDSQGHVKR